MFRTGRTEVKSPHYLLVTLGTGEKTVSWGEFTRRRRVAGVKEDGIVEITTSRILLGQKFLANLFNGESPGGLIPVLVGNEESCGEICSELFSRGVSGLDNAAGVEVGAEQLGHLYSPRVSASTRARAHL